jgi:hypothetical protein
MPDQPYSIRYRQARHQSSTSAREHARRSCACRLWRVKIMALLQDDWVAFARLSAISRATRPLVSFHRQRAWCLAAVCFSMDTACNSGLDVVGIVAEAI